MTNEVRYIVEKRKFKRTWDDYLTYWEFMVPILTTVVGLIFLFEGKETINYVLGILLILSTFLLTKFLFVRLRQLNGFEELQNERTNKENFEHCIQILKTLKIKEIDKDIHNLTINAKHRSTSIPPIYEWLTIVCLDNKILVNSRPAPATMLFWLRRNAITEFINVCNGASH